MGLVPPEQFLRARCSARGLRNVCMVCGMTSWLALTSQLGVFAQLGVCKRKHCQAQAQYGTCLHILQSCGTLGIL